MPYRFFLAVHVGFYKWGCEALVRCIVHALTERFGPSELVAANHAVIVTVGDVLSLDYSLAPLLRWVAQAEAGLWRGMPTFVWVSSSVGPFGARPAVERRIADHRRRYAVLSTCESHSLPSGAQARPQCAAGRPGAPSGARTLGYRRAPAVSRPGRSSNLQRQPDPGTSPFATRRPCLATRIRHRRLLARCIEPARACGRALKGSARVARRMGLGRLVGAVNPTPAMRWLGELGRVNLRELVPPIRVDTRVHLQRLLSRDMENFLALIGRDDLPWRSFDTVRPVRDLQSRSEPSQTQAQWA